MASVIDSLFVELGLDTKNFDANQKKSVKQLKDFEDQAKKTGKNTQEAADGMTRAFEKVGKELLALGSISLGLSVFKDFISSTVTSNASLGRSAALLGMSARELDAWGGVAKTVGGNAADMKSAFQGLQGQIAAFATGHGNANFLAALAQIDNNLPGQSLKDKKVDIYALADALKRLNDQNPQVARNLAEQIGLNDTAFFLFIQGREKLKALYDEMERGSGVMPENAAAAERLQKKWAALEQQASGLGQTIFRVLTPAMDSVLDRLTKATSGGLKGAATSWLGFALNPMATLEGIADKVIDGGAIGGQDDVMKYFMAQGWTKQQAAGIAANIQRESGFNPGASGDGGKAYGLGQWHPDRQKTFAALYGHSIQQSTFDEQLSFYNWELNNSEKGAGNALKGATTAAQAAGIVSSQFERPGDVAGEIAQRGRIADQIFGSSQAGAGGSTNNSQMHNTVGSIVINTNSSFADGIARDIGSALASHAFIGAGMAGAQ